MAIFALVNGLKSKTPLNVNLLQIYLEYKLEICWVHPASNPSPLCLWYEMNTVQVADRLRGAQSEIRLLCCSWDLRWNQTNLRLVGRSQEWQFLSDWFHGNQKTKNEIQLRRMVQIEKVQNYFLEWLFLKKAEMSRITFFIYANGYVFLHHFFCSKI